MQKKHRIFIAINFPSEVKKYLAKFQERWAELPAKWASAENLHITMVFLGDLTDQELGEVCMATKEVVKNCNSFDINLNKVSYGPDDKIPPRMVWVGGGKNKELSLLKKNLEESLLGKINFKLEERLFNPHVTLARISTFLWRQIEPEERPEVAENIDVSFTVESIEVMESELKRSGLPAPSSARQAGPQYITIESHQLQ